MIAVTYTLQSTLQSTGDSLGQAKTSVVLRDPQRISLSGSKIVNQIVNLTASAFTNLMTGSIADYRYVYFGNQQTASVSASWEAVLYASASGVVTTIGVMKAKDSTWLSPISGTIYYAKASGSGANLVQLRVAGVERQ